MIIQKQFGTCEPQSLAERDYIQELGCSDLAPCLFWIKKKFKKRLPVSEKSRKKTVLYKKRFVKEKALKIIFCEHY